MCKGHFCRCIPHSLQARHYHRTSKHLIRLSFQVSSNQIIEIITTYDEIIIPTLSGIIFALHLFCGVQLTHIDFEPGMDQDHAHLLIMVVLCFSFGKFEVVSWQYTQSILGIVGFHLSQNYNSQHPWQITASRILCEGEMGCLALALWQHPVTSSRWVSVLHPEVIVVTAVLSHLPQGQMGFTGWDWQKENFPNFS